MLGVGRTTHGTLSLPTIWIIERTEVSEHAWKIQDWTRPSSVTRALHVHGPISYAIMRPTNLQNRWVIGFLGRFGVFAPFTCAAKCPSHSSFCQFHRKNKIFEEKDWFLINCTCWIHSSQTKPLYSLFRDILRVKVGST